MAAPRVVLVDGSGLERAAFQAFPTSMRGPDGGPTNTLFAFARMFRRIYRGRLPTHGVVLFDGPPDGPDALARQRPGIEVLIDAHGFPRRTLPGALHALAGLWGAARRAGCEVTVAGVDPRLAQLVTDDGTRLFDPLGELFHDPERIRRRFGARAARIPDWLALVGDGDVPGVPGVGPAAAAALLAEHADLESALATDALRRHAERVRVGWERARLRVDAPPFALDGLTVQPPGPAALNACMRRFGFDDLLVAEPGGPAPTWFVCDAPDQVRAALAHETAGDGPVGLHVLVDGDALDGALVGVALAPRPGRAVYVPLRGEGGLGSAGLALIAPWLSDPTRPKCTHDLTDARLALAAVGVTLAGVVGDTAIASYQLDPTRHPPHRIEQVARSALGRALQPVDGVLGSGRARVRFDALTIDRAGAWSCHLADATVEAWGALAAQLDEDDQRAGHDAVELPLAELLARCTAHGIAVDRAAIQALDARLKADRDALAAEVYALAGRPFAIGSLKELGRVLFDELGLPVQRRTKTGWSVTAEVLDALDAHHPIAGAVRRWREVDTLIHATTEVLLRAIDPRTGRIHARFEQTASASGRLITSRPDLQRTPAHGPLAADVRRAFVAPPGHQLLSADWSQIELRVLAHVSGDPALIAATRAGADLHARTAAALFDVDEAAVTPAQREVGKTVNFGTLYGQGAAALAAQLRIPHARAKAHIRAFFAAWPGVAAWRERTITRATIDGAVRTLAGRRRRVPELATRRASDRAHGERIAVNTVIQGSAADLCKAAMLRADHGLRAAGLHAALVLQIHDELLFEVPDDEVERVAPIVRAAMEGAWALSVPLTVRIGVGASWADAKR